MLYIYSMKTQLPSTLGEAHQEIAHLRDLVARLQHQLYGQSSEKLKSDQAADDSESIQQDLFEKEAARNTVPAVSTTNGPSYDKQKPQRDGHGRRILPDYINRNKIVLDIPESEKVCDCGCEKAKIGEDISEELGIVPLMLVVNQYIRLKYACPRCPSKGVHAAALPSRPIERGLASPELLAYIIVSKYLWHLPLNRQEKIFEHYGIKISRSTMCTWEKQLMPYLWRIWDAMKSDLLTSGYLQADETPITVLDKAKTGKVGKGYLWPYTNGEFVVFEYRPGRGRVGPQQFLEGYVGYVQTDGWESAYGHMQSSPDIIRLECWAHARRKLFEARECDLGYIMPILHLIHRLYVLERRMKRWGLLEKRAQLRQSIAAKYLDSIAVSLRAVNAIHTPKSAVRKAVNYILNRWDNLTVYLRDSRLEIDNNRVERAIRPVAIGRNNWTFAGSEDGADKIAVMFSIVNSCKMLDINPQEYLTDVLTRIADHPASRIVELTPAGWKMARNAVRAEL